MKVFTLNTRELDSYVDEVKSQEKDKFRPKGDQFKMDDESQGTFFGNIEKDSSFFAAERQKKEAQTIIIVRYKGSILCNRRINFQPYLPGITKPSHHTNMAFC